MGEWGWGEFLRMAATPGVIPLVVGALLSVVAEYVPGWAGLSAKWKRAAFFAASLVVPVLAAGLGVLTEGWEASWAGTFWPAIVAGVAAFGGGTLAHLPQLPSAPEAGPVDPRVEGWEGRPRGGW